MSEILGQGHAAQAADGGHGAFEKDLIPGKPGNGLGQVDVLDFANPHLAVDFGVDMSLVDAIELVLADELILS